MKGNEDWYGLSRDGELLRMTGAEMAKWARQRAKLVEIGWANQYTFSDDEVGCRHLKGARFVRAIPGSRPSDRARAVGWEDLARALEAPLTPEEINALPERIRRHIHDLATLCDPAGMVQEIGALKDQVAQLTERHAQERAAQSPAVNEKLEGMAQGQDACAASCQQAIDRGDKDDGIRTWKLAHEDFARLLRAMKETGKEWIRPLTCGMPCSCERCTSLRDCVATGRIHRKEDHPNG